MKDFEDDTQRVIVRKHEIIPIPDDVVGVPLEEAMPHINWPEKMRGGRALMYDIPDRGKVIAQQEEPEE